jgi:hypothetical protein
VSRKAIDAQQLEQVKTLYAAHVPLVQIARCFGVSKRTVNRHLHEAGVPSRGARPVPPCARCGRPTKRARDLYCSMTCRRVYPVPEPRECELPECAAFFTPRPDRAGRFCSHRCAYASRRGRVPPQFVKAPA